MTIENVERFKKNLIGSPIDDVFPKPQCRGTG